MSQTADRLALIEVTAAIEQGHVVVTFGVNRRMQHQVRSKKWAQLFVSKKKKSKKTYTHSVESGRIGKGNDIE